MIELATTDGGKTDVMAGDFEACAIYRVPLEHDEPFCAACGHLADDHAPAGPASVTPLRRRPPRHRAPARQAS